MSVKTKKWFFRIILIGLSITMVMLLLFFNGRGWVNQPAYNGTRKISIGKTNGKYCFLKDNKPFLVKGASGFSYIKELAACGGNTISCWDTSKIEVTLKEAAKYNVMVIIGLDIPGGEDVSFYNDPKNSSRIYDAYSAIVHRYRQYPALLAWSLGNELTFPFSLTNSPFYKAYNKFLNMVHATDPQHPVSTSVINVAKKDILNIQWRVHGLDFLCINTYNSIKYLKTDLDKIKLAWSGPYLVSEWAPNGGWEADITSWEAPIENTSTKKAEQYYDFFVKYMPLNDPRFLGSMAFYWGSRQEYTYSWYSIFNEDGSPTEIKEVLNDCWKNTVTTHYAPQVAFMLVDSLGAKDNILLSPGTTHTLSVLINKTTAADTLQYKWQILKEGWQNWGQTWNNFQKPSAVNGLIKDSSSKQTSFVTPLKEGPYRVFVTVNNARGYSATSNTPIYIIE